MVVAADVAVGPQTMWTAAEVIACRDGRVHSSGVIETAEVPVTESGTTEVLETLRRLRAEGHIDLDDAVYFTHGKLTYVNFVGCPNRSRAALALTANKTFALSVDVDRPHSRSEGMLLSYHDRNSGFAFYVKNEGLFYEYDCAGSLYSLRSNRAVPTGRSTLRLSFTKTGHLRGAAALYIDEEKVGETPIPLVLPACTVNDDYDARRERCPLVGAHLTGQPLFSGAVEQITIVVDGAHELGTGVESCALPRG